MDQEKSDLDLIVEAARAAKRRKPVLEAERMSKLAELEAINRTLNALQAVIDAAIPWDETLGGQPAAEKAVEPRDDFFGTSAIDQVLINGPLRVQDIHKALSNTYAMSTVYALLNKGKKVGYYTNENAMWGLSEEAMRKVKAQ